MEINKPLTRGLMAANMIVACVDENTKLDIYNDYLEHLKLQATARLEVSQIEQQINENKAQITRNHQFMPWLQKVVESEVKIVQEQEAKAGVTA